MFFVDFRGLEAILWDLDGHFESLRGLLAGLLGGWVAALMGRLLVAGRLAGHRGPRS